MRVHYFKVSQIIPAISYFLKYKILIHNIYLWLNLSELFYSINQNLLVLKKNLKQHFANLNKHIFKLNQLNSLINDSTQLGIRSSYLTRV